MEINQELTTNQQPSDGALSTALDTSVDTDLSADSDSLDDDPEVTTAPPEFVPNPTFRVMETEKNFDEFLLPAIKDADSEKRVRELYEKAHGLDFVKQDRQVLREENTKLKEKATKYDEVETELKRLGHFINNGDLASYFEASGLSEKQVIDYLVKKEELSKNPQLMQQYNQNRQQIATQFDQLTQQQRLQAELDQQKAYNQQMLQNQRASELDNVLSDPNVSSIQQQFDARMGPGAFKNEVIQRGLYTWQTQQKDLSPKEAIEQVARLAGFNLGQVTIPSPGATFQNNSGQQATPGMSQGQRQTPNVIPNIGSGNATPVKPLPTSIKDLRQRYNEMNS